MRRRLALLLLAPAALATAAEPGPGFAVRTASTHPMKYALSLPEGRADGPRPVVVVIPDASRDFEGNLAAFARARGARPFVLVAPHVVTSGGAGYRRADTYRYSEADWKKVAEAGDFRFDDEGIAAVLADVRREFGGEERAFLTGWEAGGHTVWALAFRHPERWRAVAPVSTNYLGRWMDETAFSKDAARASLPIRVLFCEKAAAPQGWDFWKGQTATAMKAAEAHGFGRVALVEAPGRPHGPLTDEVLAFFDEVRPGR